MAVYRTQNLVSEKFLWLCLGSLSHRVVLKLGSVRWIYCTVKWIMSKTANMGTSDLVVLPITVHGIKEKTLFPLMDALFSCLSSSPHDQ